MAVLTGCSPQQPFYFHPDKNADSGALPGRGDRTEVPYVKEQVLRDVDGGCRPCHWSTPKPSKFGT